MEFTEEEFFGNAEYAQISVEDTLPNFQEEE